MKRFLSATALACATILLGALGFAAPASADLLFTLDISGCCGAGPFATVLLHDVSPNVVDVTVTLEDPPSVGITNTGLTSFPFNNSVSLTSSDVSNQSSGFSWATTLNGDGAGTFQYGFDCGSPACGSGGSDPFAGPFSFTLTAAGLSSTTFTPNTISGNPPKGGNYFGVDICYNTTPDATSCLATGLAWTNQLPPTVQCTDAGCEPQGCTGPACSNTSVPEPAPLALIAVGALAMVGFRSRRRSRSQPVQLR